MTKPLPHLTLILGGARSGKSRQAETLAQSVPGPWVYVATGEALDAEMGARIAAHQARRGEGWITLEAPLDLAGALAEAPEAAPVVIDCLTLWLTNLMLGGHDLERNVAAFETAMAARPGPTIAVANEVGLGIVPDSKLGRDFRDQAGLLNQRLAARADAVLFMVAGLPMTLKDAP